MKKEDQNKLEMPSLRVGSTMKLYYYEALKDTLISHDWKAFGTLTFPPETTIDPDHKIYNGKFLTSCKDKIFKSLLSKNINVKNIFWVFEGPPPSDQRWHIHFLADDYINLDTSRYTWYKIVGSDNEDHLKTGFDVKKIDPEEITHFVDYIMKDVALQDVEIRRTLKEQVQKPYGFYGTKDLKDDYLKRYDDYVKDCYKAEIELETKQNSLRYEKFIKEPSYELVNLISNTEKLKVFKKSVLNYLEDFPNDKITKEFTEYFPSEAKLLKSRLEENKVFLSDNMHKILNDFFMRAYYRLERYEGEESYMQLWFMKNLFSVILQFILTDKDDYRSVVLKLKQFDDQLGLSLIYSLVYAYNTLMEGFLKIDMFYEKKERKDRKHKFDTVSPKIKIIVEENYVSTFEDIVKKYLAKHAAGFKMPMVFEPKLWKFEFGDNHPLQTNVTGGYILNGVDLFVESTASGAYEHKLYVTNDNLEVALNHIQTRPFKINFEMFDYLNSKECALHKDPELKKELKSKVKGYKNQQFEDYEYQSYLISDARAEQSKIGVHNKLRDFSNYIRNQNSLRYFWFPYGVDFRTRMVAQAELNPMTSKELRALLLHPIPLLFDLDLFKYNAMKLFYKEKLSFEEALKLFDTEGFDQKMFNFKVSHIYKRANEPYAMLAACFEWKRYVDFTESSIEEETTNGGSLREKKIKNYRTYFMTGVDAPASGHQILSMIMNDGTYQDELNLGTFDNFKQYKPYHFYTIIAKKYLIEMQNTGNIVASYLLDKQNYTPLYNLKEPSERLEYENNSAEKLALLKILVPAFKALLMKGLYNASPLTFFDDIKDILSSFYRDWNDQNIKHKDYRSTNKFIVRIRNEKGDYDKEKDFKSVLQNTIWNWKKRMSMVYYISILKKASDLYSKHNYTIKWLTRTGGYVLQYYNKHDTRQVFINTPTMYKTVRDNNKVKDLQNIEHVVKRKLGISIEGNTKLKRKRPSFRVSFRLPFANPVKMSNALPPDYIHSLDADIIYRFTQKMISLPYISFFLVHDTIDFPLYYYYEVASKLAEVNNELFAEEPVKDGMSMFQYFVINDLIGLLKTISPDYPEVKADIAKTEKEINRLFKEAQKAKVKEFHYEYLMTSRSYY